MPTGIILKSASHEVSDEVREKNLQAVVEGAGYEVAAPEVPAEPKRDDFKSEEEFEAAHVEWQDDEEAKEVEEEEKPKAAVPPKKSRRERAVERATAKLQEENAELRKKLEAKGKTEEPAKEAVKPKRADFGDDEAGEQKYEDALIAWGVEKATKEKTVKDAEDAETARLRQNLVNYATQIEEAKEEHEDWDELFAELAKNDIRIGNAAQNMIFELENGAEVSYYLARHPATARKLGEISELSAVAEVVRLSERLKTGASAHSEANEEKVAKPKPKVPAPVRTVNTAGSSTALTFAEIAQKPNYPGKARDLRRAMSANE